MTSTEIERGPYGRTQVVANSNSQYHGETYYGQPAVKPSHYGQLIAGYLFLGGIAGASQMIAAIADWCGRKSNESIVRAGRYLSLGAIVTGPLFLIADLRTPQRWYHMLRIFRRTSPMSMGSWTLAAFGALSGITAALQFAADRLHRRSYRRAAESAAIPATAAGAVVATYTGTLIASTSTPLWARAGRLLPALFGISATATSTAALSLAAQHSAAPQVALRRLQKLALLAAGAELVVSAALDRRWDRDQLAAPLKEPPLAAAYTFGYKGLGIAAPLIVHGISAATGRYSRRWSIAAGAATLIGGYFLRSVIVQAGRRSAERPEDYFRITRGD